nr:hypothetical protein GCM10020093_026320 [Planobispora longispora]
MPLQRLELAPTLLDETVMDDLTRLLGRVHERELFGLQIVSWSAPGPASDAPPDASATFAEGAVPGIPATFSIVVGRHATTGYDYADLRRAVLEAAASRPGPWLVQTLAEPVVTVAARVTVPPLGRTVLASAPWTAAGTPEPAENAASPGTPETPTTSSTLTGDTAPAAGGAVLDNGLLRVTVAPDGSLSLRSGGSEVHGVGRVVDGGDAGDTYNHAPPRHDVLADAPSSVEIESVYAGPLVSVLEIRRTYDWPVESSEDGRAATTETVAVTTRAELRAGEPYLRLETSFDNRTRDHRVRWHAPLPGPPRSPSPKGSSRSCGAA